MKDSETTPEELSALFDAPGGSASPETDPSARADAPGAPHVAAAPTAGGAEEPGGAALIRRAIRYPVTVWVGVLLVALFGFQALFAVPIQLTPDVSRPTITVETFWPGANPQEVEREIIEEQEEFLKSLEGLTRMTSQSLRSVGRLTLEFVPGTDIDIALLKVNNKLNQVPAYPDEAERPVLRAAGEREDAIGWFVLRPRDPDSGVVIAEQLDFVEDVVEPRLERVPGVAAANVFGGVEREILVEVDPDKVATRGLTMQQIGDRLRQENRDVSAGDLDELKRSYAVRTVGAFEGTAGIEDIVLREDRRERVYLRDVAEVSVSHKEPLVFVAHKGHPAIAMNAQRQIGSNVLEVMDGIQRTIDELNEGPLKARGLVLEQVYDSSVYIRGALDRVQQNILLGGLLAIVVLLLFLRSVRPTMIIAVAIPISGVGTFLAMYLLGRNVNVVSLAGLSFAVGMLVDNSIVVLENIFTHLQQGEERTHAAVHGTTEVWGAIFASTATTVAVFLPIFFIEAEIGQLFRDIAIAICCAVVFSLIVSVQVIPMLAARWLKEGGTTARGPLVAMGGRVVEAISGLVFWICGSTLLRVATVVVLTVASLGGSWWLAPPAEYLPSGNRNFVFGILIPPSGYSLEEFGRIQDFIASRISPMWEGEDPELENFFFVAFGRRAIMGASAAPGHEARDIQQPIQQVLNEIPGMIAIVIQAGLFDQGLSGGRSIELEFRGPDLERLVGLAGRAFGTLMQTLPGSQTRPEPGLELGQPELRIYPDRERLAEAGLTTTDLGWVVDVFTDGVQVSEVRMSDGKEVDLTLKADPTRVRHTQDVAQLPVALPNGDRVPVEALGTVRIEMGPDQINHSERERTISLVISPSQDVSLEEAMRVVREQVAGPMEADGSLRRPYSWHMTGTADKLSATRKALQLEFLTAVVVTFLLMASLFESFLLPLVILFSVPLASFGGFAMLSLVHHQIDPTQRLDVITMLGFVILIGVVVNNAILLVDRTLRNVREEDMPIREAVAESVSNRIRPIFMSTLTSVFGMAPLVLMSGPGSELYRGIGSVVVGGLMFSTVFTLVLIPALLSLVLEARRRLMPDTPL